MALRLGTSTPAALRVGTSVVSRMFLGSTPVWPMSGPVSRAMSTSWNVGNRKLTVWHFGWNNSDGNAVRLSAWPANVRNKVNTVCWAMAQSASSGTGSLSTPALDGYSSQADAKSEIDVLTAAGKKVCLGVGGSGDGGITMTSITHADQFVASCVALRTSMGFNGVSVDLEGEPGTQWTQAVMVYLLQQLKANGFYVDVCFAMYGTRTTSWPPAIVLAGSAVDQVSIMLYDFDEAADSRLSWVSRDKLNTLQAAGVDLGKVTLLYAARPSWSYPQSTPTSQLVIDALNSCVSPYPTFRGSYGWWDDKALASQTPTWNMANQCITSLT